MVCYHGDVFTGGCLNSCMIKEWFTVVTRYGIFEYINDNVNYVMMDQVMPYSTGCHTPLSNFESGQNYKDTVDPAGGCLCIRDCLYLIVSYFV